ncbi:NAD-dependent DNA ligase LigA, partial [Candidatus Peregrinibacteria bacterium]|nr:NAD-dependent DNA ligase LigA [Candidatus Peregrinibacteria bacterium]
LEEITNVDGIGEKVGQTIHEWFNNQKNQKYLQKLQQVGIILETKTLKSQGVLSGKSFVLTGTLATLTRDQAKNLIKQLGGKVHSSLTKDTNYLIVGESPGSKLKKARELKIETLDEEQFKAFL